VSEEVRGGRNSSPLVMDPSFDGYNHKTIMTTSFMEVLANDARAAQRESAVKRLLAVKQQQTRNFGLRLEF
jgi:hypothetical protein